MKKKDSDSDSSSSSSSFDDRPRFQPGKSFNFIKSITKQESVKNKIAAAQVEKEIEDKIAQEAKEVEEAAALVEKDRIQLILASVPPV